MQTSTDSKDTLYGLTSFGGFCGNASDVGKYTKISSPSIAMFTAAVRAKFQGVFRYICMLKL